MIASGRDGTPLGDEAGQQAVERRRARRKSTGSMIVDAGHQLGPTRCAGTRWWRERDGAVVAARQPPRGEPVAPQRCSTSPASSAANAPAVRTPNATSASRIIGSSMGIKSQLARYCQVGRDRLREGIDRDRASRDS